MKNSKIWMILVLIIILVSVLSMFLPVLTYIYPSGKTAEFNVISFISPPEVLMNILGEYNGSFVVDVQEWLIAFAAILAVLAIIAAFAGVITMSLQRENTWQFIMTLVGIIGTALPSVLILLAVILSRDYFPGTFRMGVYPLITPIAMVLCLITVTQKHKRTKAEIQAMQRAEGLIRRGGDLIDASAMNTSAELQPSAAGDPGLKMRNLKK